MRFLVDEDLPRSTDSVLRQHGHEAVDVRDIGLRGAGDAEIAAYAQKQGLCLLSGDMGFADIRNYPPWEVCGNSCSTPASKGDLVYHTDSVAESPRAERDC